MTDAINTTIPVPPTTNIGNTVSAPANEAELLLDPVGNANHQKMSANEDAIPATGVEAAGQVQFNGATFDRVRSPKIFKPQSAVACASEATVWTPASGKKFRLQGGTVTSSAAGNLIFKDNTAGTTIAIIPALAGAPVTFDFKNGILSAAANNVLTCTGPSTATLSGTLYGTEE